MLASLLSGDAINVPHKKLRLIISNCIKFRHQNESVYLEKPCCSVEIAEVVAFWLLGASERDHVYGPSLHRYSDYCVIFRHLYPMWKPETGQSGAVVGTQAVLRE